MAKEKVTKLVEQTSRGRHPRGWSKYRGELQRLEAELEVLTPSALVDAARPESSPLHSAFNWDDSDAAEKYRMMQARMLMTSVRVDIAGKDQAAFVNVIVSVQDVPTRGYISTTRALSDEEITKQLIRQATRELNYWTETYNNIQELSGVVDTNRLKELEDDLT